jgi:hypothetical protein
VQSQQEVERRLRSDKVDHESASFDPIAVRANIETVNSGRCGADLVMTRDRLCNNSSAFNKAMLSFQRSSAILGFWIFAPLVPDITPETRPSFGRAVGLG